MSLLFIVGAKAEDVIRCSTAVRIVEWLCSRTTVGYEWCVALVNCEHKLQSR